MRDHYGMAVFDSIEEVMHPTHCALLVIDMQNDLVNTSGAYASAGEDVSLVRTVIDPIRRLIDMAHSAGVPVIYTMNETLPDGRSDSPAWAYWKNYSRPGLNGNYTIAGTWGVEIIPELAPEPQDSTVRKHRSDGFVGTDLDLILKAAGAKTVVTCGIVTNGCVESTARHAAFLDYHSVVVGDACASSSLELHEAALRLLGGRHDVVSVDTVEQLWGTAPQPK
jgi:nicotinamidase-related amidase